MSIESAAPQEVDAADLLRAQGLALALVGGLLEGGGVVAQGEFGRLLGLLGTVTAETNGVQGDILAVWSATVSGGR